MKNNKQKAFTLAELTLAIIIISILIVGFAPVITKRLQDNIKVNANTQGEYKLYLFGECEDTPGCTLSAGANACDCKFSAPQDAKLLNVVMVSGGGAGGNATESWAKSISESHASENASSRKNLPIVQGMHDVKITYISGSGGGGGGGSWDEIWSDTPPASQADCDPYDAKFLTAEQNGGYAACVTKYNVGDISKAQNWGVAPTVVLNKTGVKCTGDNCCWHGRNGRTSATCTNENGSYGGCNRSVCKYYAAKESCETLTFPSAAKQREWRLPTVKEMTAWSAVFNTISAYQKDNGIMICGGMSGFGVAQCHHQYSCPGTQAGYCTPDHTWSEDYDASVGEFGYSSFDCNNGNFYLELRSKQYAQSTRCIFAPEVVRPSLSGGGGGGAPFIKNYTIPDDVIKSNVGGTIILYSAPGGKGGASASSQGAKGSDGEDGEEALIQIKDKNNKTVWALKVLGGKGGKGATSSSGGAGGAQSPQNNSCQIYENNTWKNINCTGYGEKGRSGTKVSSADETTAAQGGTGGGSTYNSDSHIGGGTGGGANATDGGNGTVYGAGGGGGTVGFDSSENPKKGKGGKGHMGAITIEYKVWEKSAAGGGGGGGAFIKVRDINITPNGTYDIRIGAGGTAGGYFGNDGNNGGDSFIKFGTLSYIASGGEGGKGGKIDTSSGILTHGTGGAGAKALLNTVNKADTEYHNGKAGTAGANVSDSATRGGYGGESGIKVKGGCGGMFSDPAVCTNPNANGISIPFVAPDNITQNVDYGTAGAGGGGGGWNYDGSRGISGWGAKGQDGYVYIYWSKN